MRLIAKVLVTWLLWLACAQASPVAFVNVNVVTMQDDQVLVARSVIIRDGRIATIGPVADVEVPAGALVVDGTDRYLLPGFAEMHAHVPSATAAGLQRVLALFVANGVTSVRGMLGHRSHLAMRSRLENGELLGPRLYTAGPSFNGNSVNSPRQAAAMVRRQHADGYDFLKIHPGLTRAEFRAVADTAAELGIRFAGHVPADVGLRQALVLGLSTVDHLDGYLQELLPPDEGRAGGYAGFFGLPLAEWADEDRVAGIVAATVDAGTWNVPTQSLFEHRVNDVAPGDMAQWPEMKYVPEAQVQQWVRNKQTLLNDPGYDSDVARRAIELRRLLIKSLHEDGAGLLLGSDAPQVFNVPGFSLHRELAMLVDAGLTPFEALQTGTVNAARWMGREEQAGSIATGKQADLVLLDDNPLADIANSRRVHGVLLRGRWLDRQALDALLARYER